MGDSILIGSFMSTVNCEPRYLPFEFFKAEILDEYSAEQNYSIIRLKTTLPPPPTTTPINTNFFIPVACPGTKEPTLLCLEH